MAKKKWPPKDPDERLDYTVNWADRVGTEDPIVESTFAIVTAQAVEPSPDTNLAIDDESITDGEITADGETAGVGTEGTTVTDGATTVWLTGGELGLTYQLINRIATQGGRIMDQSIYIQMKMK